ncbi:PAS-domain containing protein [Amaricoccus sp.]|uniref:PAS-domain containing protein n=1 Tax=Amaricoccus sp. TaxID=1872485 RepID=UPI001B5AE454|nr:PAS-domain containing protein [Amaricoccus sp.]MBP7242121.1 PAS-domain containing protein [Amaricoccus sp.]
MNLTDFLDAERAAAIAGASDFVVAAVVSAVVTLGLAVGFGPRRSAPARMTEAAAPGACDFLLHGATVQPLTEAARRLAAGLGTGTSRLAGLRAHLAADCRTIDADLEALILYGVGFRRHLQRADGAFEVLGEPRDGAAYLSIRPASEEAQALRDAEAALRRAQAEAAFLEAILDRAPVLAWSVAPDGQVGWANAPYRDRFVAQGDLPDHRIPDGFAHVLEEVPLTPRAGEQRRRVAVPGGHDREQRWFELSQGSGPNGGALSFALEADDLVAAEASLRRFIETLTETFAHLPIGLAVFDKNRRLGLFNPALTELVRIDAVWLAGRPSLRDFLERLRETRQMPEQKDFAAWRRKLGEIEEGAREGAYEENWVLPSGKIFRVTGRPHPQGALAFLFEDISTAIQLERKYRSELELSQATLDRMVEAVAVFDTSGMLVFVNSAFEALWGLDPMERLDGPGVADLTALWAERCRPSPAWARLCDFATGGEARASWTDAVETRDGRILQVLVAPLPDASALVVFRNLTEERAALTQARAAVEAKGGDDAALVEDLAYAALEAPVEAAVQRIMAAIPSAASPGAFQSLGAAVHELNQGLAKARELRGMRTERAEPSGAAVARRA